MVWLSCGAMLIEDESNLAMWNKPATMCVDILHSVWIVCADIFIRVHMMSCHWFYQIWILFLLKCKSFHSQINHYDFFFVVVF